MRIRGNALHRYMIRTHDAQNQDIFRTSVLRGSNRANLSNKLTICSSLCHKGESIGKKENKFIFKCYFLYGLDKYDGVSYLPPPLMDGIILEIS